jgi:hypothetical protein
MATPGRSAPPPPVIDSLDRLEALLTGGPPLFPPGRRAAWDDEARELLRVLRDALSTDTKRASAMGSEAESILRRAQDEARRIVLEAEDHARRALEDGTLGRAAEQQLQQIREQAVREADETRRGADMYAMTVLERLEREVARILATVQRGKAVLSERTGGRASAAAGSAPRLDNGKLASV